MVRTNCVVAVCEGRTTRYASYPLFQLVRPSHRRNSLCHASCYVPTRCSPHSFYVQLAMTTSLQSPLILRPARYDQRAIPTHSTSNVQSPLILRLTTFPPPNSLS